MFVFCNVNLVNYFDLLFGLDNGFLYKIKFRIRFYDYSLMNFLL